MGLMGLAPKYLFGGAIGIMAVAILSFSARNMVRSLGKLRSFVSMSTRSVEETVELSGGTVEVEGTARPVDDRETITAPFSGTEAVYCECRIKRRGDDWTVVHRETHGTPFEVVGDHGRLYVDPDGADATLTDDHQTTASVEDVEEFPREITSALSSDGGDWDLPDRDFTGKYRFTELRIDVDDDVYVFGESTAGESPPGSGAACAISQSSQSWIGARLFAHPFVISNTDEQTVERRHLFRAIYGPLSSLVGLGVGLFFFVVSLSFFIDVTSLI